MSEDSFTEVTSESWFGRIGGAIKGILLGLVLFAMYRPESLGHTVSHDAYSAH